MSMRTYEPTSYPSPGDYTSQGAQEDPVSVFDRYSSFDGTFNLTRDLRVEGQVKGTITCQGTFFVAEGAQVSAEVEAENISVAGDLNGDVVCRGKLQILATGKVRGKITTATLVINEGAFYEGELVMDAGSSSAGAGTAAAPIRPRTERPTVSTATATPVAQESRPVESSASGPATGAGGSTFIRRFGGQETTWDQTAADTTADDDTQS